MRVIPNLLFICKLILFVAFICIFYLVDHATASVLYFLLALVCIASYSLVFKNRTKSVVETYLEPIADETIAFAGIVCLFTHSLVSVWALAIYSACEVFVLALLFMKIFLKKDSYPVLMICKVMLWTVYMCICLCMLNYFSNHASRYLLYGSIILCIASNIACMVYMLIKREHKQTIEIPKQSLADNISKEGSRESEIVE